MTALLQIAQAASTGASPVLVAVAVNSNQVAACGDAAVRALGPNPYRQYSTDWSHEEDRRVEVAEAAQRDCYQRQLRQETQAAIAENNRERAVGDRIMDVIKKDSILTEPGMLPRIAKADTKGIARRTELLNQQIMPGSYSLAQQVDPVFGPTGTVYSVFNNGCSVARRGVYQVDEADPNWYAVEYAFSQCRSSTGSAVGATVLINAIDPRNPVGGYYVYWLQDPAGAGSLLNAVRGNLADERAARAKRGSPIEEFLNQ
ncbi:hypothetical protein D3C86_1416820 [compost metagenome]